MEEMRLNVKLINESFTRVISCYSSANFILLNEANIDTRCGGYLLVYCAGMLVCKTERKSIFLERFDKPFATSKYERNGSLRASH